MWRDLRDSGVRITSSWIDEDGEGQTEDFGDLWQRIENEIRRSSALVLYVEPSDFPLKGALVEVGMALAIGLPINVVAPGVFLERSMRPIGSWAAHPSVCFFEDVRAAAEFTTAARTAEPEDTQHVCDVPSQQEKSND
jgi:hypothetical protein